MSSKEMSPEEVDAFFVTLQEDLDRQKRDHEALQQKAFEEEVSQAEIAVQVAQKIVDGLEKIIKAAEQVATREKQGRDQHGSPGTTSYQESEQRQQRAEAISAAASKELTEAETKVAQALENLEKVQE